MSSLIFSINKEASQSDQSLAIEVLASDYPTKRLEAVQLHKVPKSSKEGMAVEFLLQQEAIYQKKKGALVAKERELTAQIFHVAYSQAVQALKLLAATGRLFFKNQPLVCDFFSQNDYYYVIEALSGKMAITARVKTSLQDFDVCDSDFICGGPPHIVIKGISLKLITTEVSWSEVKKALLKTLKPEDLVEEPDNPLAPKIVYLGDSREKMAKPLEPFPLLMLKDRSGAFADLYMDYGDGQIVPYHDAHFKATFQRNISSEQNWERDLLETDFIKKMVGNSHYYCPMDKLSKSLGFLLELGWCIKDYMGKRLVMYSHADLNVNTWGDKIIVKGKLKFSDYEADLSAISGSYSRKEHFIPLDHATVGLLDKSWEATGLSALYEEGEVVGAGIGLPRSRLGVLHDLTSQNTHVQVDPILDRTLKDLEAFEGISSAVPSSLFQGQLRAYQQQGVNWLTFLYDYGFHGILADDMGLGKTVQVLAFLSRLQLKAPVLIVVPTSLIFNWRKEIEQFLPGYKVYIHHGPDRSMSLQDCYENCQVILTSYAILRLDLPLFLQHVYACLILDEAQVIKNSKTQIFQAVCRLQSQFRLLLTGTPLENHLNELWAHFRFLMPDLLGDLKDFEGELAAGSSDFRYLHRIKKKIRPFILRRKKEEVAKDLPEKIEQTLWVEMTSAHRQFYNDFLAGVKTGVLKKVEAEGVSKCRMEILEAILRLRQICCHPLLVSQSEEQSAEPNSSKLDMLLQDLETLVEEGKKVLVYSQFTSMLKLIAKEIRQRGWRFVYLDGATTDREKIVDQFQTDPSLSIFLISLKAGGIGLNLTQADYVLIYDPWWNEAAENQAIDRAHRIGRRDTVIAKRYITLGTIEEKIMSLKSHKRNLLGEVLEDNWDAVSMTSQDLLDLLS